MATEVYTGLDVGSKTCVRVHGCGVRVEEEVERDVLEAIKAIREGENQCPA